MIHRVVNFPRRGLPAGTSTHEVLERLDVRKTSPWPDLSRLKSASVSTNSGESKLVVLGPGASSPTNPMFFFFPPRERCPLPQMERNRCPFRFLVETPCVYFAVYGLCLLLRHDGA